MTASAEQRDNEGERTPGPERTGRSLAEWATLAISLVILFGIAGLVTYLYAVEGSEDPAITIEPRFAEMRQVDGLFYLPVTVTNDGDRTAADVRIMGELPTDSGEPETAEIEIMFLAGQESADGTMIFSREPTESELRVFPVSFQDP